MIVSAAAVFVLAALHEYVSIVSAATAFVSAALHEYVSIVQLQQVMFTSVLDCQIHPLMSQSVFG